MLHRSQIALNDRFTCPFLISAEEDSLSTEDIVSNIYYVMYSHCHTIVGR